MQTLLNKQLHFCLVLATILVISPLYAATLCDAHIELNESWRLTYRSSNTHIYQPLNTGNRPPSALVHVNWEFNPYLLYRSIWNYNAFPAYIPNVKVSRILEQHDDHVRVYQRLRLPRPARDRHYVLLSTDAASKPAEHHYQVEWQLDKKFPKPDSLQLIEPERFRGCWDIRSNGENGSDARYWIELEPGGWLPDWLVQRALHRYLIDLLDALKRNLNRTSPTEKEPADS